jgi:NDP-sugar pyrophosphorylase family protein
VRAITLPGVWYEVGDPARYIDCQLRSLEIGDVPLGLDPRARRHVAGYASEHAQLQSARLRPPYLVGAGVRLRHGSRFEGVVLADRTRVEASCRLQRVVTWKDSWIGRGADLEDVVVMAGVRVPAGTVASGVVFTATGPVAFGSDEEKEAVS